MRKPIINLSIIQIHVAPTKSVPDNSSISHNKPLSFYKWPPQTAEG